VAERHYGELVRELTGELVCWGLIWKRNWSLEVLFGDERLL
jgi:hypothetical protein